jgi:carbamoyl-phosphate synthase/aspartate carbamoyltransferase/dihydroorotase
MTILRLPGLADPHVHVRGLGQRHKEDFGSCTRAALAGGFTTILAMPNTRPPIVDAGGLAAYQEEARAEAACDYGFHLGATESNVEAAAALAPRSTGLKLYLDPTFGDLKLASLSALVEHAARFPKDRPLLAHAEEHSLASALLVAHLADRALHVCHVSRQGEIELLARAKSRGVRVTCEVCPHHLFLQEGTHGLAAGVCEVRPVLATPRDVEALWANLDVIDCFATYHAPHTRAEKAGERPPPGFPGLETALPLFLTAVHEGKLTLDDVRLRMADNVRRIFDLPEQEAHVEVDVDARWTFDAARSETRAGWSPFDGAPLRGRVERVVLRGEEVVSGGRVVARPGLGRDVRGGSP